jgi:NAD-dependent SIR2 family protein deacetylase
MSRVAMFLGAGASKAFGTPLTSEILPTIKERLSAGTLFSGERGHEDRQQLGQFLSEVMPGIKSADAQYVIVTEILSLIDYMLLSAFVPSPRTNAEQLHLARILVERAILEVLEWPYDPGNEQTVPAELSKLARWMYEIGNESSLAIVSTNYDETIETELYRQFICKDDEVRPFDKVNQAISFGLSWRDGPSGKVFNPPIDPRHYVLKLHGSVNWLKCDLCGWIVCNDENSFAKTHFYLSSYGVQTTLNTCECGHWPLRPVIVAPSLVREVRDINLLSVWKVAHEQLRVADDWFMIGYSLPIEDYAIRAMLIRALKSRKQKPRIQVYQWGQNRETEARYRAFFGDDCVYHTSGMQGFIRDIVGAGHF